MVKEKVLEKFLLENDMGGENVDDADEVRDTFKKSAVPESAVPVSALPVSAAPVSALPVSALPVSAVPECFIARARSRISNALFDRSIALYESLRSERGDVPGWVLVVLMTTGLVTGIWTLAAPRIDSILRNSLDSMNNVR